MTAAMDTYDYGYNPTYYYYGGAGSAFLMLIMIITCIFRERKQRNIREQGEILSTVQTPPNQSPSNRYLARNQYLANYKPSNQSPAHNQYPGGSPGNLYPLAGSAQYLPGTGTPVQTVVQGAPAGNVVIINQPVVINEPTQQRRLRFR